MGIHLKASASLAGLALTAGLTGAGMSPADASRPEPCTQQQAQVDRATNAMARVSAVFARQQARVGDAAEEVADADTASERATARRDLANASARRDEVKQTKRAQQQRLAKAQVRLDKCLAAQPAPAEPPVEAPVEAPVESPVLIPDEIPIEIPFEIPVGG